MMASDVSLWVSWVWVFALLARALLWMGLAVRQARHVLAHRHAVPSDFAGTVSLTSHQRAARYTVAKLRLGWLELVLESALLVAWTLLGGLNALNAWMAAQLGTGLWTDTLLLASVFLISTVLMWPVQAWRTFVLEAGFGFNKTSPKLWLIDQFKALALGAALGLPLVAGVLALLQADSTWGWLWVWALWMSFSLLMMVALPLWIAPLFNHFTPLSDDGLRTRVTALMQRCGFDVSGLFVMDGSRRSAHANAYFTGFGKARRVVFFDTLLQRLSPAEVEAVLAHELGHAHHRHVTRRVALMGTVGLAVLALWAQLSAQAWFYTGLGVWPNVGRDSAALALILLLWVAPVLAYPLAPLGAALSRRDEFQADAYAAQHASAPALRQALLKLYDDNAATLTPDPVYEAFYASHPGAAARLGRLTPALP